MARGRRGQTPWGPGRVSWRMAFLTMEGAAGDWTGQGGVREGGLRRAAGRPGTEERVRGGRAQEARPVQSLCRHSRDPLFTSVRCRGLGCPALSLAGDVALPVSGRAPGAWRDFKGTFFKGRGPSLHVTPLVPFETESGERMTPSKGSM